MTSLGNWGITAVGSHMWGNSGDFSTSMIRPFVSYNVSALPGFSISTSPQITYDWKSDSDNAWSVPLGGGVTQAIPFSSTFAVLVGLSGYKFAQKAEFDPDWQANLTIALMFAENK